MPEQSLSAVIGSGVCAARAPVHRHHLLLLHAQVAHAAEAHVLSRHAAQTILRLRRYIWSRD